MADKTIGQLTAGAALTGVELLEIEQSGNSRRTTAAALAALAPVAEVAGLTGIIAAAALRSALNVEDGATGDQTGAEIVTAINGELGGTGWQSGGSGATDLGWDPATRTVSSSSGGGAVITLATTSLAGLMAAADKTKLDGIAEGATGDMAGAAIVAALDAQLGGTEWRDAEAERVLSYDAATRALGILAGTGVTLPLADGTNAGLMASAQVTKLAGVETGATADQTAQEIAALIDADAVAEGVLRLALTGFAVETRTGAAETVTAGHLKILLMDSADAQTLTLGAGSLTADGQHLLVIRLGAGAVTLAADGVTLEAEGGTAATIDMQAAVSVASVIRRASGVLVVTGAVGDGAAGTPQDLSYTAATRALGITDGTGVTLPEATGSVPGLMSAADKTALTALGAPSAYATAAQGALADTAVQPAAIADMVESASVSTIVEISQSAYDALGTPDAATLYLITS